MLLRFAYLLLLVPMLQAGDWIELHHYRFHTEQGAPEIPEPLSLQPQFAVGNPYYLLHFDRKMTPVLRENLQQRGIELLGYIPHRAFVARVADVAALQTHSAIDWFGPWQPAYKVHPTYLSQARHVSQVLHLNLHRGSDMTVTQTEIEALGGVILDTLDTPLVQRFLVRFPSPVLVRQLAGLLDVNWISPPANRELRNDRARWLVQSYRGPGTATMETPVYDAGLMGEGEVIGLLDSTPDLSHCLLSDPEGDEPGPDHRLFAVFNSSSSPAGHGTHVAGTVAGHLADGNLAGAGVAPAARIAFSTLPGNQSGNLFTRFETHAAFGAAIHSNSWGESFSQDALDYTVDCSDIDNYTWQNEDDLVLFACANSSSWPLNSVISPENALNVLAVGATESGDVAHPEDLAERHGSCGMGPAAIDGRRKPEIFAPGCHLYSADSGSGCEVAPRCGTSMATPVTAASAALIRQYFREGFYPTGRAGDAPYIPSGALLKALLLVGTEDMVEETELDGGAFQNNPIPNRVEGWGRLSLENTLYFTGDRNRLLVREARRAEGLSTDESFTQSLRVLSADEPLSISLVFTQPPATPGAGQPVSNNLDLVVTSPTGLVYRGNVFDGGTSTTGGEGDAVNNVEMVRLDLPEVGLYSVEISATEVNEGPQGYALAMTGDLVSGSCEEVTLDAGDDVVLTCWGDTVTLGEGLPHGLEGSLVWSPAEGLSDTEARTPVATPTETTTYTVTATLEEGCIRQASVTVTVPAMDVDDSGSLSEGDVWQWIDSGWTKTEPALDYNVDGQNDIRDVLFLMGCIP